MQTLTDLAIWRSLRREWQRETVALVPTMGHLHAGHLALVTLARQQARRVVVTIFVNPLQFGPQEDYAAYPRTLAADQALLAQAGVDVLLAPAAAALYPQAQPTQVLPPATLTETLCGLSRPGHFSGVATIVLKLLNLVQPDMAFFGAKDWQQWRVIGQMVADLDLPARLCVHPVVRAADGLALSSRNAYLNQAERAIAPQLYQVLTQLGQALRQGCSDYRVLEAQGMHALVQAGFAPEYVAIRHPETLGPPEPTARMILAAARLGQTRLIDNLNPDDLI